MSRIYEEPDPVRLRHLAAAEKLRKAQREARSALLAYEAAPRHRRAEAAVAWQAAWARFERAEAEFAAAQWPEEN